VLSAECSEIRSEPRKQFRPGAAAPLPPREFTPLFLTLTPHLEDIAQSHLSERLAGVSVVALEHGVLGGGRAYALQTQTRDIPTRYTTASLVTLI
jgi:hypothetical protein